MLTREERERYSRHLSLQGFGEEGQLGLKRGSVLVVGAGGLGCPALQYLAAAGVGRIGIVDDDTIARSNLQRQVLYTIDDIGQSKAAIAAKKLSRLNDEIIIESFPFAITSDNALELVASFDVVLDGTDNFQTRYLLNDSCVLLNKPLIYGAVLRFEGQVATFNVTGKDGEYSSNYRDLFPTPPPSEVAPSCEDAGVLGVLPGLIGTLQATEVLKLLTGFGRPLTDSLLVLDVETFEQRILKIRNHDARAEITGLVDYDHFCGKSRGKSKSLTSNNNEILMKEITVQELQRMREEGEDFQLIDVREEHEFDICNLEGELIPMSEVPHNVDKIARDKKVIVHCRSGKRSGDTILWLERNHQLDNLYNLKGGILAWAREIDPSMPTY